MYQPPHRRVPGSASLPARAPPGVPVPARQPPLPNHTMRGRRDLSLPLETLPPPPPAETPARAATRAERTETRERGFLANRDDPAYGGKGSNSGSSTPRPRPSPRPTPPRTPSGFSSYSRRTPAPSEMELLASVARSGGDGAEGDALKNFDTQVRFRAYIDEKIHAHHHTEDEGAVKNIVRLFRKLREGIVASSRLDRFAIEVFESSVRYAVIARDAPQLLSALSGLVPGLYLSVDAARAGAGEESDKCAEAFDALEKLAAESHTAEGQARVMALGTKGYDSRRQEHVAALAADPDTPPPAGTRDNRAHFASLLLIYHLVHSPRPAFQAAYEALVSPPSRPLVQRDYADPPTERRVEHDLVPFTTPAHLAFARAAAAALAPETFDSPAFGRMVRGKCGDSGQLDHPAALERALLAWASPRVRDEAGARLKKAYVSCGIKWAAAVLNLEDSGVMLWAMANGASVRDGVVKLR